MDVVKYKLNVDMNYTEGGEYVTKFERKNRTIALKNETGKLLVEFVTESVNKNTNKSDKPQDDE